MTDIVPLRLVEADETPDYAAWFKMKLDEFVEVNGTLPDWSAIVFYADQPSVEVHACHSYTPRTRASTATRLIAAGLLTRSTG